MPSEYGSDAVVSGSLTTYDSGSVFNEGGAGVDFRVESDGNTHMIYVSGGADYVGIGTSTPDSALTVAGAISGSSTLKTDGTITTAGDLNVTGTITGGGIAIDTSGAIMLSSSLNATGAIRMLASAGGIDIDAVGTPGEDINITNTGGSINITATEPIVQRDQSHLGQHIF